VSILDAVTPLRVMISAFDDMYVVDRLQWEHKKPSRRALLLLKGLLTQSKELRYSAQRAFEDPWFTLKGRRTFKLHELSFPGSSGRKLLKRRQSAGAMTPSRAPARDQLTRSHSSRHERRADDRSAKVRRTASRGTSLSRNDVAVIPEKIEIGPARIQRSDTQKKLLAMQKEAHEKVMDKIRLLIKIFDEDGDGRLNLPEMQTLFKVAKYSPGKRPFPDEKTYKQMAKKPEEGMSESEMCWLIDGSLQFLDKLLGKVTPGTKPIKR